MEKYKQEEKDIILSLYKKRKPNIHKVICEELKKHGFNRSPGQVSNWIYYNKHLLKSYHLPLNEYPPGVEEYVLIKIENHSHSKKQIAREIKRVFKLEQSIDDIRSMIIKLADQKSLDLSEEPIKRLFWDIETSFYQGWFWRLGKQYVGPHQITQYPKIICICYKWQYEDEVHTITWNEKQDDKELLKKMVKVLGQANEIVAHNGDSFDLKYFRTRCIKQGVLMFPKYRTLDTLKKARRFFNFPSNKLDYIGEFLQVGRKIDTEGYKLWEDIIFKKNKKALKKMVEYCQQDVILLEDVFCAINPYIDHNTNHGVQQMLDKSACPNCASEDVKFHHTDTTPYGYIKRNMACLKCKKVYTVSNKTYLRWLSADTRKDPNNLK